MATDIQDVLDVFETSFRDKEVIPIEVEMIWLRKAVSRYSTELGFINYDADSEEFADDLDGYVIDTLAAFMKQSYQEREVSKVNKRVSIVSPSLSLDGNNGQKTAAKAELEYDRLKSEIMVDNQKTTAYV